jgi:F-type H+-transporting ATPase subunit delta
MTTRDLVRTYARALFDLAVASDAVDEADTGIVGIDDVIRGHAELMSTLSDAAIPGDKKRAIMGDIFEGHFAAEAVAVASILVERGNVALIGEVARTYREIVESERGVVVAEVVTAVPLTDALRDSIVSRLAESMERPVSLRESVDESIIGGIVIKVAGRVLDGSFASQLDAIRSTLSTA